MTTRLYSLRFALGERRTLYVLLATINLVLTGTTALFIFLWARLETLDPLTQWLVKYILVQGHLATENVVAAWYSAMLLLGLGVLSLLGFIVDTTHRRSPMRYAWVLVAAVFVTLSVDEVGSLHERLGMVAWLSPSGIKASGWIYVLALPIGAVSVFLLGFAFVHLRHAPGAAPLVTAGVGCFALNPVVEAVEMALLKRQPGSWGRLGHDLLLVLEEGGLELFGILFFIAGVTTYLNRVAGPTLEVGVSRRAMHLGGWATVALLGAGAVVAPRVTARFPAGDTGLLHNWFPAAAWFLVAIVGLALARLRAICIAAVVVSACFGAGLYGYVAWLTLSAPWQVALIGVLTAGGALGAVLAYYRLSFSPRSSIASPTLRRPRPNPS